VACSLNSAKLTPTPSHVAPSGEGLPGQTRSVRFGTQVLYQRKSVRSHATIAHAAMIGIAAAITTTRTHRMTKR